MSRFAAVAVFLAVGLSGCDDAARKPVQGFRSSAALTPAPDPPQGQQTRELGALPLPKPSATLKDSLLPHAPGGIDYLIAQATAKFQSGQANYRAGHLAAARRDFDDAVDWILESGYDPNSDARLRELFQQITDTVYTYELQAFRAGDGFTEAPAVPAPIDEVAEMTFPADPKVKERAEQAAKSVTHDLPLTVNDVVPPS